MHSTRLLHSPWSHFSACVQVLSSMNTAAYKSQIMVQRLLWGVLLSPALLLDGSGAIAQVPQQAPAQPTVRPAAQPFAQPFAQPNPAPFNDDGYLLGSGDRIKVEVFDVPEFTGEYLVLPNGTINMPVVGPIPVQNRTLQQAGKTISARYAAVLQRPTVTVGLVTARPIRIAISGEVNRPGSYTVSATPTAEGGATLSRTLQLAEGITQAADLRRVQIRRVQAYGSSAGQVMTVDLWSLLQNADLQQDLQLRDGDSIFIPATTAVNLEEARQLSAANFAARNNRPLKVAVVGEVYRPGPYTLLEGAVGQPNQLINPNLLQVPSVTRAIQIAGGITQSADIRNVQVRRLTRSGPPQIIKLDFWKLLKTGDVLQDLPLQDGDTVEIPTATSITDNELTALGAASFSPDKITVNVVGEVKVPGPVSILPNSPLNQAILAAGGFVNNRASKTVTLIRLNPNGTVEKREIGTNFAQGVSQQNNPALRNNDIIVVKRNGLATFSDGLNSVLGPFNGILGVFRLFGLGI